MGFDTADTVICMQEYRCLDVTDRAKQISREMPLLKALPTGEVRRFGGKSGRRIVMSSLQPQGKVKADRDRGILYGNTEIDLSFVEQLVDTSQTRFIMDCLVYLGDKIQSDLRTGDHPKTGAVPELREAGLSPGPGVAL